MHTYDWANRLTPAEHFQVGASTPEKVWEWRYDALGNMTYNSEVVERLWSEERYVMAGGTRLAYISDRYSKVQPCDNETLALNGGDGNVRGHVGAA